MTTTEKNECNKNLQKRSPKCGRQRNSELSHKEKEKGQGNCHKHLLLHIISGSVCYDLQGYDKMLELQGDWSLKKHDMISLKNNFQNCLINLREYFESLPNIFLMITFRESLSFLPIILRI